MKVYDNCKVYGPYISKQDGRKRVIVKFPNGRKTTVSYPKYLVEMYLNRYLDDKETVDHIDGDFTNNNLSNLRLVDRTIHAKQDAVHLKSVTVNCVYCKKLFTISGNKLRNRNRRNNSGFCSRSCSGKYGKNVQLNKQNKQHNKLELDKVYYKPKSALEEILSVEELNIGETLTDNADGNTEA